MINSNIIKTALKKLKQLLNHYDGFINVILDDWRGIRFVYDTVDVRRCKNICSKCLLYQLLKNEDSNSMVSLYPASLTDKKLFGQQNFLNCKTLRQYQNCYTNFLIRRAKTRKQIEDELNLIKDVKIIFSRDKIKDLEDKFRIEIINQALLLSDEKEGICIRNYINKTGFSQRVNR